MNGPTDEQGSSDDVQALLHLLQTDPDAFGRLIEPRMRLQYQRAIEALCAEMQNPDRERAVVSQRISRWLTSGQPAPEHVQSLAKLERIAREAGGTAYVAVEQAVFQEMTRLSHPDLVPFMLEAFHYRRRYDNFAVRRREYAVDIVATIAARSGASDAIGALDRMLSYPTPQVRGVALDIIYEAYQRERIDAYGRSEMQAPVLDLFWRLGRDDPDRRVRQTALALLQRMGQISYAEAIAYLEGKTMPLARGVPGTTKRKRSKKRRS